MGADGVYMADIAEIVDTATDLDRHVIDPALQHRHRRGKKSRRRRRRNRGR